MTPTQQNEPKDVRRWPRWLAPTIGVAALAVVQVAFVSIAAWPILLFDDEFVRTERATVLQEAPGYLPRWVIRLENGDIMKMPPPDGVIFAANSAICVKLLRNPLNVLKARQIDPSACGGT